MANKKNHSKNAYLLRIIIALIQTGLIYLSYSLATKVVSAQQLEWQAIPTGMPVIGNLVIFLVIILAIAISVFLSGILVRSAKVKELKPASDLMSILKLNFVPAISLLIAAYITFDQLLVIIIYLLLFVLIIFFRDF